MADINYVSPAGMQPKLDWAPTGFLAGKLYSDQQKQYEDTLGLSQASSMYGLQKQRNELEDYKLNTVLRERERAANIAKADATTQTALPQALANLDQTKSSTAANQASTAGTLIDNQTRGARNKAALDEKTLENRIKQTDFLIKLATMYDPKSPTAIEDLTNILGEAKENKVPEWLMRRVATNPTAYKLQMAREREAYIQAMDVAREQSRSHLAVANVKSHQERLDERLLNDTIEEVKNETGFAGKSLPQIRAEAARRFMERRYRPPYMDPGTKAFTTKSGEDAAFWEKLAANPKLNPEIRAQYLKNAQEARANANPTKGNTPAPTYEIRNPDGTTQTVTRIPVQ